MASKVFYFFLIVDQGISSLTAGNQEPYGRRGGDDHCQGPGSGSLLFLKDVPLFPDHQNPFSDFVIIIQLTDRIAFLMLLSPKMIFVFNQSRFPHDLRLQGDFVRSL